MFSPKRGIRKRFCFGYDLPPFLKGSWFTSVCFSSYSKGSGTECFIVFFGFNVKDLLEVIYILTLSSVINIFFIFNTCTLLGRS